MQDKDKPLVDFPPDVKFFRKFAIWKIIIKAVRTEYTTIESVISLLDDASFVLKFTFSSYFFLLERDNFSWTFFCFNFF